MSDKTKSQKATSLEKTNAGKHHIILVGDRDATSPMKAAFAAALSRYHKTSASISMPKDKKDHA